MAKNMKAFLFLSLIVLVCLGFSEAQKVVPAMYVFGDSLVDVGNNNHLKISIAKANFPHNGVDYPGQKPTGRFSNGKNFADFIAEKAGLATSPPPYLSIVNGAIPMTGVSFASGGAGIFNGTDERYRQSLPLSKQLNYYSTVHQDLVQQLGSASAQNHLSKSLFTVVVGSNDLFDYFQLGSNVSKNSTPQQYVDSMLLALKQVLKSLHGFGGRKYVIAGIGAVGCCPSQRNRINNEECYEEENQMALKYNQGLKSMLEGLKSELKGTMTYSYIDVYGIFDNFIRTPSTFGFTEVKAACCGLGNLKAKVPCLPVATYCSNRSDHIFWDLYHPTEAAARILVDIVSATPANPPAAAKTPLSAPASSPMALTPANPPTAAATPASTPASTPGIAPAPAEVPPVSAIPTVPETPAGAPEMFESPPSLSPEIAQDQIPDESGSNLMYEVRVILSGLALWAVLAF